MKKFYVTFGNNHIPQGNSFYVVVHAENEMKARQKTFEKFGEKWAFIYNEDQKAEAIDRFNMCCLEELR